MANQSLPTYDLQELAAPLLAIIDAAPDQFARLMALQNLLLEGQPVSLERIASRLHIAREEVPALIRGAELDAAGNFVGWGLTLVPTPHSYQINGRQFYTWCAEMRLCSHSCTKPARSSRPPIRSAAKPSG